jgi:hypothetical protein
MANGLQQLRRQVVKAEFSPKKTRRAASKGGLVPAERLAHPGRDDMDLLRGARQFDARRPTRGAPDAPGAARSRRSRLRPAQPQGGDGKQVEGPPVQRGPARTTHPEPARGPTPSSTPRRPGPGISPWARGAWGWCPRREAPASPTLPRAPKTLLHGLVSTAGQTPRARTPPLPRSRRG